MFTAALFTRAKIEKQPKCPSTDECIKKQQYIYVMKYYSTIKNSEISPSVTAWIDLEGIILSEVSQTENDKYSIIPLKCEI